MPLFERIKTHGINRLEFGGFLVIWIVVGLFVKILFNAASHQSNGATSLIVLILLFVHYSILALAVYFRLKNANVKYILAVVCCFVPFLQIAPIIAGLWYKPNAR